jgi:ornithine cyclodeaminase/alanine dehydrogenase-like protein (mu-crystallin family)
MLYLSGRDIMEALTFEEVMGCVEEALRIYETRAFIMPEQMAVPCGEDNVLLLMPCVSADHIATKLVSVYPGNKAWGKPVIDGMWSSTIARRQRSWH